ncbi:MAG TPA: zf-HC2 domain-containing protein [Methylomirabilota bacterium]
MSDDRHFERLVRGAARRGRETPACPDPALLAAYVDGSLDRRERADLERHAADCLRCTEQLALLAALEGPGEAPETVHRRLAGVWQGWRWLVPLATAVVVFAVWQRADVMREPAPVRQDFEAPSDTVAEAESDSAAGQEGPSVPFPDRNVPVGQARPEALMERAPAPPAPSTPERGKDESTVPNAARAAPQYADAPGTRRETGRAEAPRPAPPSAADSAEQRFQADTAQEGAATRMALERKAAGAAAVVAAGPGVLMRITARGVERSADGGAAWTLDLANPPAALRVLSCPSEVCWAGGDQGLLLRRERSGTWTPRELPTRSPLVGIEASGDAAAIVTTEDGGRFRTSDGGTTWTRIKR